MSTPEFSDRTPEQIRAVQRMVADKVTDELLTKPVGELSEVEVAILQAATYEQLFPKWEAARAEVLRLRRQVAKEHAKYLEADVYRQTEAAALRDAEAEVLRLREALTALVVSAASFDGIRLSNAIAAARALLVEGSGVPADNRAKNLGFQKGWPQ